ncbi:hypothetical protein [Nitratireductor sp. ZSWI3]|uniref:hypothetical protein n=1 Tax=Nitratireductor sp. ZSWI3 TaxID=2966359 RepID=UPI00215012E1|nr:hypothetical protein [Nitratireductor sp. ZSWI3]MCR4267620.1 hypothetical protein [Nitratireductor sp. ZSWI3]
MSMAARAGHAGRPRLAAWVVFVVFAAKGKQKEQRPNNLLTDSVMSLPASLDLRIVLSQKTIPIFEPMRQPLSRRDHDLKRGPACA